MNKYISGIPNLQMSNNTGIGLGLSNTPFGSRTASYSTASGGPSPSQQQQHSRSQSSMATISRCQSPTHSAALSPLLGVPANSNIYHSRLHQTVMITTSSQIHSPMASYNNIRLKDAAIASKPLYPEVCLEHVWTENIGVSK